MLIVNQSRLNFEMVVPVRTSAARQLPHARNRIGEEKRYAPSFILLDANPFMPAEPCKFFRSNSNDDMTKSDCTIRKCAFQRAALCQVGAQ